MNERGKSRGVTPRVVGPGPREPSAFEAGLADLVNVLNNRLAAMVGFAQLLARRSHAPEDRETVDRVVAEAMSAAQLVRDIVRLIRKPAGQQESTSLRTALEKALRRAHRELAGQQVEVTLDVDATVPLVAGRREDIVDLFMRLLRFAAVRVCRTPPPRHVTLTARAYGAGVVVSQVDSGPPLPAADARENGEALARTLGRGGPRVTLAATGEEALDHRARAPFDAVVVDIHMPRLGGQAVYEQPLPRSPDLARRFVFVTGDDARARSRDFLEHVAQPLLFKPYVLADLLVALGAVSARQGERA